MAKVRKIVTDGGSNVVCAFKERPRNLELLDEHSQDLDSQANLVPVSIEDILTQYVEEEYNLRPHQRCASHRCNLIMNDDIESARKETNRSYDQGNESEDVMMAIKFFELYDVVLKECQKLWFRQQGSSVSRLHL